MKIAKEFRWEMGHRLPEHTGLCRNIHGHSYRMVVEITGDILANGMIIDFYDLGKVVKPLLDELDHCFLVYSKDKVVLDFLKKHKMKMVVVDYLGTVENICADFSLKIVAAFKKKRIKNISEISVKIFETPNSFAQMSLKM
jgi:6-pyruvoyltetrahydropterin/6-carboxytetrahydropterin synthase